MNARATSDDLRERFLRAFWSRKDRSLQEVALDLGVDPCMALVWIVPHGR